MRTAWTLTFDHLYHVIDDMAVLVLWAEHDNFRIGVDFYVVPRRPVEEIIRFSSLLSAFGVSGSELAAQNKAPMRAMTQVSLQPLKQRCRVNTRRESEIFTADFSQSSCIAEIVLLTDHCTGDFHLDINIFLRYPHDRFYFLGMDARWQVC